MLNMCKEDSTRWRNLFVYLIILCFASSVFSWMIGEDAKLHKTGRKYIQERNWIEASKIFHDLLNKYPNSLYCDNALFWIGFSFEQETGREIQAFETYQKIVDKYPQSPWINDAIVHQIFISKKLIQKGDETYRPFLKAQSVSTDRTIRFQAALALSELNDESSILILEEMVKESDPLLAQKAINALANFSSTLKTRIQNLPESTSSAIHYTNQKSSEIIHEKLGYKRLKTQQQVLDNGLYHILSEKDLTFYLSLENDWDRRAWWHRFWTPKDPTPTTEKNEAEEEFINRVLYAYKHFKKEWLDEDPFYPPWDSRGEVLIKYGWPDKRTKPEDKWEEWTYKQMRLSFKISDNLPNSNGEGIDFSLVSHYIYRNNIHRHRMKILFEPQFHYIPPYLKNAKKIEDFYFQVSSISRSESKFHIQFEYHFPGRNLTFKKQKNDYHGAFRYRWVIFDEDFNIVSSSDLVRELSFNDKKRIRNSRIEGLIETDLPPGIYQIALRIEDLGSKALGIYRKNFQVNENI